MLTFKGHFFSEILYIIFLPYCIFFIFVLHIDKCYEVSEDVMQQRAHAGSCHMTCILRWIVLCDGICYKITQVSPLYV